MKESMSQEAELEKKKTEHNKLQREHTHCKSDSVKAGVHTEV